MDEKFEEVVEFVGEGVDGAGLGLGGCIGEGERSVCFVAGGERNILEVAVVVSDVFACVEGSVHAGYGHEVALRVASAR